MKLSFCQILELCILQTKNNLQRRWHLHLLTQYIFFFVLSLTLFTFAVARSRGPSIQLALPSKVFFLFQNIYFLIYLTVPSLSGSKQDLQLHVGSSSLTRDRTWAPCIGSAESQPLHQGNLRIGFSGGELKSVSVYLTQPSKEIHDLQFLSFN